MRKLLILCLVFLSSTAFANPIYLLTLSGTGVAVATYLFQENFEGNGYENTWVESITNGSIDEDHTTALRGSQSLKITANAGDLSYTTATVPTPSGEMWGHFIVNVPAVYTTALPLMFLMDSSDNVLGYIMVHPTGGGVTTCTAAQSCATGGATNITSGTWRIWWKYTKGTGANGVLTAWVSNVATTTRPGTHEVTRTNLTATTDAAKISMAGRYSRTFIYDQVITDDAEFLTVDP